jgi:hypothetical protein
MSSLSANCALRKGKHGSIWPHSDSSAGSREYGNMVQAGCVCCRTRILNSAHYLEASGDERIPFVPY